MFGDFESALESIPEGDGSPTPHITSLTPTSGPTAGGTSVVITGTAFAAVTAVAFGVDAAASFTVDSDTQITAVSPAHSGPVLVSVSTDSDNSNGVSFLFTDGGGSPYADAVLADAPLLYWRLGEDAGTDAVDASGNGNDGTYTSADMHTAGLLADGNGAASIIDGSQVVDTPVGPTYLLADYDDFTLEVIVESISFGSGTQYWGSIPGSPYFFVSDMGVVEFDTDLGSVTGPTLELGQAYHLCATYDGTTLKMYVNGTLVGSRAIAPPGINGDPAAQWSVGYVEGASGVEQDAAFYDHAISADRVMAHATAADLTTPPPPEPPMIDSVTPSSGFNGGGTLVTIEGSNFDGATDVQVDGVTASSYSVTSDEITLTTDAHVDGAVDITVVTPGGTATASAAFTFVDEPDSPVSQCISVTVGDFVADGSTPDGNGIVYEVESLTGWYDTPPVRSETMEAFPTGEFPTVYRENGRRPQLVITAHAPSKTDALGGLGCWQGIAVVKAAFDALYLPVMMAVADPLGTTSGRVRLASPTRASIVGDSVMARLTLSLIAPDPRLT